MRQFDVLRPARLVPGRHIAVVTPSSPGAVLGPHRYGRALNWLRDQGWSAESGALAHHSSPPARAKDRAAELNQAFRDPNVGAVIAAMGGLTANAVLRHLDYEALAADPKPVIGYSDITAILLAIHAHTGMVTFHGPTLMPEIGEFPGPLDYTSASLRRILTDPAPVGALAPAPATTSQFLLWDHEDDRPRTTSPTHGWQWLNPGRSEGPLWGGNLETIGVLAGTPHLSLHPGRILFLETTATSIGIVQRQLTHLEDVGVFDDLAGLVIGRPFRADEAFRQNLFDEILDRYAAPGRPVLADADIGHSDPMLTLPIGVTAGLDSSSNRFALLDSAVR